MFLVYVLVLLRMSSTKMNLLWQIYRLLGSFCDETLRALKCRFEMQKPIVVLKKCFSFGTL